MRGRVGNSITPLQAGGVLGASFWIVYLLTRTRDLGGDDTVFALAVEAFLRHGALWRELFHIHHPLYNPLVALVTAAARTVGIHLLAIDAGAWVSATFGAAAVGVLTALLLARGVDDGIALLTGTVLGLSGGMWAFSTRMEVYTLAALAVTLWLVAVSGEPPRWHRVSAALGLAGLAHLATGVLWPATVLARRRRWRAALAAAAAGATLPAAAVAVQLVVRGGPDPRAWRAELLPATYGHYLALARDAGPLRALESLLWWGWYRAVPLLPATAARVLDAGAVAATALSVTLLLAAAFRPSAGRPALTRAAWIGIACFLPLWLVWDVGNVEHTVAAAPLFAALLAHGAAALPRRAGRAVLAALALLLAAGNGLGSALLQSRPENGRVWTIASFVRQTVPTGGVVAGLGADPRLRLGLQYLAGRPVVDLTLAVTAAARQGLPPEAGLRYWSRRVRREGAVWLLPDVTSPGAGAYVASLGLDPREWAATVAALVPLGVAVLPADPPVLPSPFRLTLATPRRPSPAGRSTRR